MIRTIGCIVLLSLSAAQAQETLHPMYQHSGLPVPRFVSLKSDEINVRVGPGKEYPISWVYHKRNYPVKIVEEFGLWRRIEDHQGDGGWVYHSLLSGKRTGLIVGKENAPVFATATEGSRVVAGAEPGVVVDVEECTLTRCAITAGTVKGWLDRKHLWGTQASSPES